MERETLLFILGLLGGLIIFSAALLGGLHQEKADAIMACELNIPRSQSCEAKVIATPINKELPND